MLKQKFYFKDLDQPVFVSYYGLLTLWTFQTIDLIYIDTTPLDNEELSKINNYIDTQKDSNSMTDKSEDKKNLIVILVEALSTWPIKFQGGNATPFLSGLSKTENVIYIPNVLPQTNHGHSSDAQVMFNTGLLPVFNGVVAASYTNQYYPSLANTLREENNYYSLTIMGNETTTWNQLEMNLVYQMDTLISKNNLVQDELLGLGISDKSVFRQTSELLNRNVRKPFYTQIITLSSHDAIDFDKRKTNLKFPSNYSKEVINYIKSIEYVDQSIKQFIDSLKSNGLYDQSVIVIMADHEGMQSNEIKQYSPELISKLETGKTTFVPLYIINSKKKYEQSDNQAIGYIDIYPTLLDLMDVHHDCWRGIGRSIFSSKPPTFAIDKNLNIIGVTTNCKKEEINHKLDSWSVSDMIIRKKYFNTTKKDKI